MQTSASRKAIEILLVEDSEVDVLLIREALLHANVLNVLSVVDNGVDALNFLRRSTKYARAPRPNLILLDLNLPGKDGREVLAEIKESEEFRSIPVLILTASESRQDVLRAYGLHANCYITKPVDFAEFAEIMRSIEDFWLSVVSLP